MTPTLFVMDPLSRINVAGDSTYMLMLEARRRGWPVWCCTPGDLTALGGRGRARATPVEVRRGPVPFETGPVEDRDLGDFDVIWMRKDPPFDMAYIFTTYLLDLAPAHTLVLNDPAGLRNRNEKLFAQRFATYSPHTLITHHLAEAVAFVRAAPDRVVLKPWDGNGGRGVLVTHKGDDNLRSMLETLTREGQDYILLQHYLPAIKQGDKRIILVDGVPRGAMLRVPQAGDHRGNMHVGAQVQACTLTAREVELCAAMGPQLRAEGLVFVGIDVIGDALTEINVTSPTGIQEINRLDGVQLEVEITDAVVRRLEDRAARGIRRPSGS